MGLVRDKVEAPARFKDLALDARDHHALSDWWCAAIGYVRRPTADGSTQPHEWPISIVDPAGAGPLIWFNPVPERKTGKNRLHLDVWGDPGRLLALGATLVREPGDDID
ncbi:VOC family protein [Microtetraspora fusca]|uniref:VOC family protein n=1 Tax=Microtetraspora fusca TaxID=1997 RepID=A0ABW6V0I5_MICFU|nr:VOC family protein [Microtetraspora fusca]